MPPTPAPRPSLIPFVLGWASLPFYGLVAAAIAYVDPRSGQGSHQLGYVTGVTAVAVGIPVAILAVGTARRSAAMLAAAAGIAVLFVLGTAMLLGVRVVERSARMDKLQASIEELRKRTAASGKTSAEPEEIDRLVADIERTADEAGDRTAAALRCAARMIRDMATRGRAYDRLVTEMGEIGMLDPARIRSRDDLRARTALVARAEAANDAVEAAVKDMEPGFERCLRGRDASPEMIRGAVEAMRRDKRIPALLAFRAVERRVLAAMGSILSLLDEAWGTWRPAGDKLVMDRPGDADRYGRLKATLDEATRDEQDSMRAVAAAGAR